MQWKALIAGVVMLWSGGAAEQRALLIGIDAYRRPEWQLHGSVKDTRRMREVAINTLGFRPQEILTLTDSEATRQAILDSMQRWLVDGTGPGDLVLLHFSGHGSQIPAQYDNEADGLAETIVPVDARILEKPKILISEHGSVAGQIFVDNMITGHEIGEILDKLKDRRVIAFFDSCHSGGVTRNLRPAAHSAGVLPRRLPDAGIELLPGASQLTSRDIATLRQNDHTLVHFRSDNAVVFSAVTSFQEALDSGDGGVFTSSVYAGLVGNHAAPAAGAAPSMAVLLDFLQRQSAAVCQNDPGCTLGLTPTLEAPSGLLSVSLRDFARGGTPPNPAAAPPAEVLEHANDAGVSIEILPAPSVRLGDPVAFRVSSRKPGRLIVLDLNAAGQVTQIFPNEYSRRQNRTGNIVAARPLTIPDAYYGFEFRAREPVGKGTLVAIVTEDAAPVEALLAQNLSLDPVPDASAFLNQLAGKLRQPWRHDAADRLLRWSLARTEYQITATP